MKVRMKKNFCIASKKPVVFLILLLLTASVWLSFMPVAYAAGYEGETEESPAEATGLFMDAEQLELFVADTFVLTVSITPEEAACPPLTWMSSDELVAVVDEEGLVAAVGEGRAVITATAGGFSDTCNIIVLAADEAILGLSSDEVKMAQHDTLTLDVTLLPEGVTPTALTWVSSAPDVAAVDNTGNVTACGTGVAEIAVSADGLSAACMVTVVASQIQTPFYQIDRTDGLLKGVGLKTSVDDLKAGFNNDVDSIQVFCKDGCSYTSGHVGTGMTVKLVVKEDVKDELKIEIVGDVSGDGLTGVYEYTLARLHLLGAARPATNTALLDINADGKISITDYTLIRLEILGLNPGGDSLSSLPDVQPSLNAAGLGCSAALTWGSVPTATGYELYKSETPTGPFQLLASLDGGKLSYTDNTLSMEKTYHYKMLAYRMLGSVRIESLYSKVVAVSTPGYTVYYQGDPQWKFSSSVKKAACVLSSYAITINNMGVSATPRTVYESNGSRTPMNMDNLRKNFGVRPVCALPSGSKYLASFDGHKTYIKNPSSNAVAAIKEALARNPEGVILYFKKGSDAHAVVACKLANDVIYFSDPGRNRTTLVDFANTWLKVGHNMSYAHLVEMIALDRA